MLYDDKKWRKHWDRDEKQKWPLHYLGGIFMCAAFVTGSVYQPQIWGLFAPHPSIDKIEHIDTPKPH